MRDSNNNWDFWTSLPEALHQVTIVMSDRGIPKSYRTMHGFGSHAFSMINQDNERVWVKFHLRSQQGIENLTDHDADKLVGKDRESHQRDLYENIEAGNFPKRSEEHTSELQSRGHLVCRLLREKKNKQ